MRAKNPLRIATTCKFMCLGSVWTNRINAYWSGIDRAIPFHTFSTVPTSLCPMDLCTQPLEVAQFLGIHLQAVSPN